MLCDDDDDDVHGLHYGTSVPHKARSFVDCGVQTSLNYTMIYAIENMQL